jgi:hypothetical protein
MAVKHRITVRKRAPEPEPPKAASAGGHPTIERGRVVFRRWVRLFGVGILVGATGSVSSLIASAVAVVPSPAGTVWSIEHTPNAVAANGKLTANSCSSMSNCVAVGSFADSSGTSPLTEVWSGTKWRIVPAATPPGAADTVLDGVSCTAPTACTAVGYATEHLGVQVTLAEFWNGTSWVSQDTPDPDGAVSSQLTSVSCDSAGSCIAVGFSHKRPPSADKTLAEEWNGTTWILLKTGHLAAAGSMFAAVSCPQANACIGVGRYLSDQSDDWVTLA